METTSFFEIVKNYKAVFLDSYGVLKNHNGLISGVQHSIDFIKEQGITFRVLTNDASRSQEQQVERFANMGLAGIETHEIITSGMLARQFLELKINEGKIAYLGTKSSADYILESGLERIAVKNIDFEQMDDITALVFLDDEGFDWNTEINKTVNFLRRKNVPVIVANSDRYYPVSSHDVSIATGGIADLVGSLVNQSFLHFGKPDSQMFMYAYDDINQYGNFNKNEILMVGDTLETDIMGGNKFGLKTMLVLSGNTRAKRAQSWINASGIFPDYIGASILK